MKEKSQKSMKTLLLNIMIQKICNQDQNIKGQIARSKVIQADEISYEQINRSSTKIKS